MEGNPQGGGEGGGGDVAGTHVKTEAVDENTSAPVLSSQDPPAPCGDPACRGGEEGGGGGGGGGADQTAEELQAAATTTPVLLYSVSADRFFASGDGKSYLKIAPAAAMPSAPSEKMLPSGSDFSSKAVLCLIEAVGRRWGLYETRERSQLFQSVQEEMAAKGHVLPVEKIRRKWNNLIVTYKRVKDRSRETGHAKTSWEFFDLMDATLCDTVGTQIINNKRPKGGHAVSSQPGFSAKSSMKPQVSHPPNIIRPNGDFAPASVVESAGLGPSVTICSAANSGSTVAISTSDAPEVKPLLVLSSDTVTTSIHGATIVPSSLISSPCFTEAVSTSPPLGSVSTAELNASRYVSRKAPSFSPGVIPFRLGNTQSLLSVPSSFPSTCPSFSVSTSSPAITTAGAEGQGQKRNEPQASAELLQEVLKRQEEQAYLDRVARRRLEARERRRERREVRMAESLGRIATALELLSSKQDTVIALLQRLADKK